MTADSDPSSTYTTHHSGGVNLDAQHDVNIGGDVVGRDKIVQTIINEAAAPIATSLHQLPPSPRDFTGREAELAELMSKAKTDGVTISGLQGMGGVGKTALALVLAERLKPRYPDAQFYLDLKGADKQPLSVATALTHIIRAYHPTAQLPDSEADLHGLYMSLLDGKRALLLMDNAADKTQVEPLIPPSSCFLLVTSRQHFTLPGLFAKDLNTMPPDEARDLLLKIAPRIGSQADTLAKLCGYLPLALRLAGSVLAERRALTPADYVKRLEDAQARLELVEASLSLSYELLSEELQQAWCLLAVLTDTFDIAAAAAVWNVEENIAQDRADELIRYSLMEWNETTGRVRLHDLTRLFADKHLGDVVRLNGQQRHAAYYGRLLRQANGLYLQGGDGILHGLRLFDLEWANIEAGQAWAARCAEADDRAAELCSDYPDAGVNLLNLRQPPSERIRWLETALVATRRLKRRDSESWHLGNLGRAYRYLGDYHRAIKYQKQRLILSCEIGDRRGECQALDSLGSTYYSLGEYRHAIEYHEQALAVGREISAASRNEAERKAARRVEGQVLGNLGFAYHALGEYLRAIEYQEQRLIIAREIGDRLGEGRALGNLGRAYRVLGEYHRAIEFQEHRLTIAREIGDRRGEGAALGNLGEVYRNLGEYHRAIEYQEQRLTIAHEIDDRRGEGIALSDLGFAYHALGEYHHAAEYHKQALAIAREIGHRYGEANSLWRLALCYDAAHDRPQAIAHVQAALDIFTAIEAPEAQAVRDLLLEWQQAK